MKKIALLTVAFMLLSIVTLSADECRLLALIGQGSTQRINPDDIRYTFNALAAQGADNPDGWGVSYYPDGQLTTGEGTIWFDNNGTPGQNRYADNLPASTSNPNFSITTKTALMNLRPHAIIGHLRNASSGTPGGNEISDPHPFIYETDINSFSFAQNGGPGTTYEPYLQDHIQQLITLYGWTELSDPQLFALMNSEIDSGVYFGYLMAYIKLHDWNVLQGLRDAMSQDVFANNAWYKNFVMSDGVDVYAYRNGYGTRDHYLYYCMTEGIYNNVTFKGTTIMSTLPSEGNYPTEVVGTRTLISDDELVYFSPYFDPIHFENMSSTSFQLCKDLKGKTSSSTNYYCWESLPILDSSASAIQTMTQSYTEGSGFGFDTVTEVYSGDDDIALYIDAAGNWVDNLFPTFSQVNGYKFFVDQYDPTPAWVRGDLAAENSWVTLYPGQDNWVGYWLCNSQTLHDALGSFFDDVDEVEAQNWCYLCQESNRTSSTGLATSYTSARPMEFGKMYNIILKDEVTEPITFFWNNSRAVNPFSANLASTEYFVSTNAADYEVVDVESVEGGEDVKEIGVFAGDTCVGASVVDEYPVQILIYTEGYEGEELSFEYWTGGRSAVESRPAVAVWDGDGYYSNRLVAGSVDYRTVRLGGTPATKPVSVQTQLSFTASPNPFNPSTTIRFSLPEDAPLEVCVYNLRGQRVNTLAKGDYAKGDYSLVWNGQDAEGRSVSSGVYFCRIQAGGRTATGKLLLLK